MCSKQPSVELRFSFLGATTSQVAKQPTREWYTIATIKSGLRFASAPGSRCERYATGTSSTRPESENANGVGVWSLGSPHECESRNSWQWTSDEVMRKSLYFVAHIF
jgi:hypothetical protein